MFFSKTIEQLYENKHQSFYVTNGHLKMRITFTELVTTNVNSNEGLVVVIGVFV